MNFAIADAQEFHLTPTNVLDCKLPELRDELLSGEIFYSLKEAQIVVEQWRKHQNAVRPHPSQGYRPLVPRTLRKPFSS